MSVPLDSSAYTAAANLDEHGLDSSVDTVIMMFRLSGMLSLTKCNKYIMLLDNGERLEWTSPLSPRRWADMEVYHRSRPYTCIYSYGKTGTTTANLILPDTCMSL